MLKWIAGIAGGLVWCTVVCIVTWWVTFPSQAVVDRAAYEVQKASNGSMALKAASSSPWWTGVTLSDVTLLSVGDEGASPVMVVDSVSASTSLFSLIGGGLPIHGVVDLGGSNLVIDAELDRSQDPPALKKITADAPALGVQALGALLAPLGASMTGSGDVELDLDLEVGDKVKDHDGRLKIDAKGLTVDLTVPDPLSGGPFNIGEIAVSEIDIVFDVKDGKAVIKKGIIRSDGADLDLDLNMTLNDRFDRSRLRGTLVVANMGGNLSTYEGFMKDALWEDGKYHYSINCSVERMGASCLRAERQRRARTPLPDRGSAAVDPEVEERRAKAAAAREERRKQRLADRENSAANSNARRPGDGSDLDEDEPDDEELEDDEDDLDELPMPDNVELVEPMIVAPPSPVDPGLLAVPENRADLEIR